MATISPTNLRTKCQDSSFYLSVFQPVTLLAAQVNNALIARGARTIAYDGGTGSGFATIEAFQLLEVDTATGTEYVRVKSITGNQVSGTLDVDENGINWQDNQVIRVKHFYPLVAIPPSIRSQIFYKFYNVVYSDQNSLVNPVAIIGSHLIGVLSAGSVAFSLNSSSSYAIAQGATISSRVWSCVHNGGGAAGISFSSTTAANPTLTITQAGQYWLKCIVTDSNGKTQATYRAIFVYASLASAYVDFSLDSLTGDWNQSGWQLSLGVTGQATLTDFPDGALAVVWYVNKFDGVVGYIDLWGTAGQQIVCAGYLRKDQDNDKLDDGTGRVSFSVTTPESLIDNMSEMGSISLNAVAAPTKWYEYASWMTIGRAVHHLLKWHSSVLETCDVLGLVDNTLGVKNVDFTEPSVLQMVNSVSFSRGHFAKLVSSRLGRLYFVTDSQMLNTAGRAALDTVFTISIADVSGAVDVVRQPEANITLADLDGFSFNGTTSTPFISIMPGYRESSISFGLPGYRGAGNSSTKSQVLNSQTDANEKIGRVFAAANNNPQEIRLTTPGNYLGAFDIVPSIGFYEWGINDTTLKRDTPLNGRLLICRNISHQIDHLAGTIQTSVVFEPVAAGPDGIQGNYPVGYPSINITGGGVPRQPSWDDSDASSPTSDFVLAYRDVTAGAGQVKVGSISGGLNFGAAATFNAGTTTDIAVCALSATKAVVCYKDGADTFGKAVVVNISGTTISSVGSEATFNGAATDDISCDALSSTQVIVCYSDSDTFGKAIILDISGSTITPATEVTFDGTGSISKTGVARLGAALAVVSYSNGGTAAACPLGISGSIITPGTAQGTATTGIYTSICALDSATAVMLYSAGNSICRAIALTGVSASAFNYGASVQVDADAFDTIPGVPLIQKIDPTRFVAVFQMGSSDFRIKAIAGSVAAGVITLGSSVQISTSSTGYDEMPTLAIVNLTTAVTCYDTTAEGMGRAMTIAGTVVATSGGEITHTTDDILYSASAPLKAV